MPASKNASNAARNAASNTESVRVVVVVAAALLLEGNEIVYFERTRIS